MMMIFIAKYYYYYHSIKVVCDDGISALILLNKYIINVIMQRYQWWATTWTIFAFLYCKDEQSLIYAGLFYFYDFIRSSFEFICEGVCRYSWS